MAKAEKRLENWFFILPNWSRTANTDLGMKNGFTKY